MIEITSKDLSNFSFIDLFAGIGGFRLALSSYGAKCVFSSEWDKFCQTTYKENFGETPYGDITKIDEKDIPDHDILCAGFPCQPFSISGKQRGFEDTRGTLFFDVARIVKEKKPKIVFMENVKNFETHDNGNTLKVVKTTMEELGYTFFSKVLNASDYNIPQKRERIYMICFRNDLNILNFNFPKPVKLDKYVKDILDSNNGVIASKKYEVVYTKKDVEKNENKCIRLGHINYGGQGDRVYSIHGIGITLSAYGGGTFAKSGGYLINGSARKLTVRECARMMGFPESYKICVSNAQAYKQFGNSVVVDVLQYIISEIIKALN